MSSNLDQIRDQQRDTWDRFSAGWKKWDEMVLELARSLRRGDDPTCQSEGSRPVLDVAAGTGEPGLTAAALVPHGQVTVTDLSERMLAVGGRERSPPWPAQFRDPDL